MQFPGKYCKIKKEKFFGGSHEKNIRARARLFSVGYGRVLCRKKQIEKENLDAGADANRKFCAGAGFL